jgi:hypothetical protein
MLLVDDRKDWLSMVVQGSAGYTVTSAISEGINQ